MMPRSLLLLTLLFSASPAWALKCYKGPFAASVDMSRPIPTTPKILVEFQLLEEKEDLLIDLTGPRGVKATLKILSRGPTHAILQPQKPLQPNTLYKLTDGHTGLLNLTFRTGSGPDTTTPAAPIVQSVDRDFYQNAFGTTDNVVVVIDPASDANHWELELSEDMTFAEPIRTFSSRPTITAGKKRCSTNAAGYDRSKDYFLRLRSVDAGGNTSEWSMLPRTMASP